MKYRIFDMIDLFGLTMDFDQWDIEGKGWVRVTVPDLISTSNKKYGVLIIYKDDVKDDINNALVELQNFQYRIGEYLFKVKLNKLMNL